MMTYRSDYLNYSNGDLGEQREGQDLFQSKVKCKYLHFNHLFYKNNVKVSLEMVWEQ